MWTRSVRDYAILAERNPVQVHAILEHNDLGSWLVFQVADSRESALKAAQKFEPYSTYEYLEAYAGEPHGQFVHRLGVLNNVLTTENDLLRLKAAISALE